MGIIKYIVFLFNLVFAVAGLALLVVGIIYTIEFSDISGAIDQGAIEAFPILTICLGAAIFVIAFLGCCGAIKENKCLLLLYGIIILVIFVLQVALGIWALVEIGDEAALNQSITEDLYEAIDNYYQDNDVKKAVDILQESFECCGSRGPFDWNREHGKNPPGSCCNLNYDETCSSNIFVNGCASVVANTIYDNINVIGIVALVLSLTELAAGVFSLCLRSKID